MGRNGTNQDRKKVEGTDKYEDRNCRRGRHAHQSLKAYWVLQYLLNNSSEDQPVSAGELVYDLEDRGIVTDRKALYRDIREINIINYMLENDTDVYEAEEAIENDIDGNDKLVLYNSKERGYYVSHRNFDLVDIRLIVESIYSARFLTEKQSERLANIACRVISEGEASNIKHEAVLLDRVKTDNKAVLNNISIINNAMAKYIDGEKHVPCKISFDHKMKIGKDKTYTFEKGVVVSPYYLTIFGGNYSLVCYTSEYEDEDEDLNEVVVYRVDEMYNIKLLEGIARDGETRFIKTNLNDLFYKKTETPEEELQPIVLEVHAAALKDVIEKYGLDKADIKPIDNNFFTYSTEIAVNDDFYGFLASNAMGIKLLSKELISGYLHYLEQICIFYTDEKKFFAQFRDFKYPEFKIPNYLDTYSYAIDKDWDKKEFLKNIDPQIDPKAYKKYVDPNYEK